MKPVNQMIYNEMKDKGLLKKEVIRTIKVDNNGNIEYDNFGRPKYKITESKNFRIANEHKSSKAKTYFIQEDILEEYLASKTDK